MLKERLKEIRKMKQLTQDEFGKKIGISNTAVSKIERGENNLSEQNIISICREFDVNEQWLRTGEGDIFLEIPREDIFIEAAVSLSKENDKFAMEAVVKYWQLDESEKKILKDFILHLASVMRKGSEE